MNLGQKVKCHAYLKRVHDGRYIDADFQKRTAEYCDTNAELPQDDFEPTYCGMFEFKKTYYKETDSEFEAFIIGKKDVIKTAFLVRDIEEYQYRDDLVISREPHEVAECYKVAFRMNGTRYVPVNKLKVAE